MGEISRRDGGRADDGKMGEGRTIGTIPFQGIAMYWNTFGRNRDNQYFPVSHAVVVVAEAVVAVAEAFEHQRRKQEMIGIVVATMMLLMPP